MDCQLTLDYELKEIERLSGAFELFAEEQRIPAEIVTKMNIALDEIIGNIIHYSKASQLSSSIDVVLKSEENMLSVFITDSGKPFDPTQFDEPNLDEDLESRELGGLGIHLVQQLMDEVVYAREKNRNSLQLSISYQ